MLLQPSTGAVRAVRRRRTRATLLLLAAAVGLGPSLPAAAHPAGAPPLARIVTDGATVIIDWIAEPDDAVAVGVHLGLVPQRMLDDYLADGPAPPAAWRNEEQTLTASPELGAYLLGHVRVLQDGQDCDGQVVTDGNFVRDGTRVRLRCPAEVTTVDIQISLLHDIDPRYRTYAFADGGPAMPAQVVYTAEQPIQTWAFGGETSTDRPPTGVPTAWVVALAFLCAAALSVRLQRSSRRSPG